MRLKLREFRSPLGIMRGGIGIDGLFRPAMHTEIGLFVTFQSQPGYRDGAVARGFDKGAGHAYRSQRSGAAGLDG